MGIEKKLKVAVVGCGNIGTGAHIGNYAKNEGVELAWFCDIIPERADEMAEKHGGIAVYDYHELLDKDIDLVSVCTHNDMHAPISIDHLHRFPACGEGCPVRKARRAHFAGSFGDAAGRP